MLNDTILDDMQRFGFNVVRLGSMWTGAEPEVKRVEPQSKNNKHDQTVSQYRNNSFPQLANIVFCSIIIMTLNYEKI